MQPIHYVNQYGQLIDAQGRLLQQPQYYHIQQPQQQQQQPIHYLPQPNYAYAAPQQPQVILQHPPYEGQIEGSPSRPSQIMKLPLAQPIAQPVAQPVLVQQHKPAQHHNVAN